MTNDKNPWHESRSAKSLFAVLALLGGIAATIALWEYFGSDDASDWSTFTNGFEQILEEDK